MTGHEGADQDLLPWERGSAAPAGAGICISGGGLRAASFHLGALQQLQTERGLLFGPDSADILAAVSGGSYIAATQTLVASRIEPGEAAPLSPSSPEERHVASHARYLVAGGPIRTAVRFVGPIVLTAFASLALLTWTGAMLATFAWVAEEFLNVDPPDGDWGWWPWTLAIVGVAAGRMMLSWFWTDDPRRRRAGSLIAIVIAGVLSPYIVDGLAQFALLSEWSAWSLGWGWLLVAGAAVVVAALPIVTQKLRDTGLPGKSVAAVTQRLATWFPIVAGLVFISIVAVVWRDELQLQLSQNDDEAAIWALFFAYLTLLVGTVGYGWLVAALPLHLPYRDLLSRCFSIHRSGGAVVTHPGAEVSLSELSPPTGDGRFPRLLVCATANVSWTNPVGRRLAYAPFVFSHDRSGIPGVPGASHDTAKLELDCVEVGVMNRREQPAVSLMGAVAASGAAVSPSMGAMTVAIVRPLLGALGLRLGLWVANPLWERARRRVAVADTPGRMYRDKKLGTGYDRLFQEIMGLHTWRSPEVYITDGGHYDNLGLIALLRARPARVWCLDAQADPKGTAKVVKGVLELAAEELGVTHDLDLDVFATPDGVMPTTHVHGTVTYSDGATTAITVVKLGLHRSSPPELHERRRDRRWFTGKRRWSFPTHPTLMQVFDRDRFEAYSALGRDCAARAIADAPT